MAESYLALAKEHDILGPFHIGYACEALARIAALSRVMSMRGTP